MVMARELEKALHVLLGIAPALPVFPYLRPKGLTQDDQLKRQDTSNASTLMNTEAPIFVTDAAPPETGEMDFDVRLHDLKAKPVWKNTHPSEIRLLPKDST
jgi:hypothetical protein